MRFIYRKGGEDMMNQHDKEYFRQIYERNVNDVYKLCFSYLKNSHDSEDAVSMVFCRMMQKCPNFENTEQEKAWLMVTACNECKSILRSMKRHPKVDISDIPETAMTENYEKSEMLETIMELDEKYSSVLYLHFYLGYSLTEIAKITKQNTSTVRSRLFYGKKRLAAIIGGSCDEKIHRDNGNGNTIRGTEGQNVQKCGGAF